jgi:hypothetical protein
MFEGRGGGAQVIEKGMGDVCRQDGSFVRRMSYEVEIRKAPRHSVTTFQGRHVLHGRPPDEIRGRITDLSLTEWTELQGLTLILRMENDRILEFQLEDGGPSGQMFNSTFRTRMS